MHRAGSNPAAATMIDIYAIVKQINEQKDEAYLNPRFALFSEVMGEVSKQAKNEINNLVGEGKLTYHKTINGVSFEVLGNINETK